MTASGKETFEPLPEGGPDKMLSQARQLILDHRTASVSLVQRHLRVGYSRALRLMAELQQDILKSTGPDGPWELRDGIERLEPPAER